MSEAALKQAPVIERPRTDALAELLPAVHAAEVNDNDDAPQLLAGEARHFEIPARLWGAMIACYGVFFAAMFAAIGGGYATLVLVVSLFFVAMFFGTTKVMLDQGPVQARSPLDGPNRALPTLAGALREREVAAQMLIVPACVAFFGIAILVICASVG
jgi:hypothetical protein